VFGGCWSDEAPALDQLAFQAFRGSNHPISKSWNGLVDVEDGAGCHCLAMETQYIGNFLIWYAESEINSLRGSK
jgi:hypothetical protein